MYNHAIRGQKAKQVRSQKLTTRLSFIVLATGGLHNEARMGWQTFLIEFRDHEFISLEFLPKVVNEILGVLACSTPSQKIPHTSETDLSVKADKQSQASASSRVF